MKSEWKVAMGYTDGKHEYLVYRLLDADEPADNPENREFAKGTFDDFRSAEAFASYLNAINKRQ